MGNKQAVPALYNKDFVDKQSQNKKGKAREIPQDSTPKKYVLPNYAKSADAMYLKLLTWNLNMEAHSAYASQQWQGTHNKWDLVYQQCAVQDPDIISFQEVSISYRPSSQANKEATAVHPLIQKYVDSDEWRITFSPASHCGYTIILVHKRLEEHFEIDCSDSIDPKQKFPGIILQSKQKPASGDDEKKAEPDTTDDAGPSQFNLMLFGCHLHPFGGEVNAAKRRHELDRLHALAVKQNLQACFVLVGDTNMRYNEEVDIVSHYGDTLKCCWQIVPEDMKKNAMFTWYRNYFTVGGDGVSRYDKLFHGEKLNCIEVSVFDESVSDDKYHFLSDHRGLTVLLEIQKNI